MKSSPRLHSIAGAGLAVLALTWAQACTPGGDELPPEAIFHPGGAQALRPSSVVPDDLVVRGAVYVPVYSNINWSGRSLVTELAATVSVRNTDAERHLVLLSVTYYDSVGQRIQEYVDGPMELDPMSTVEFMVEAADRRGGAGANFLIEWGATTALAEPVMEAVMLGQVGNAGISFVSPGRPIRVIEP